MKKNRNFYLFTNWLVWKFRTKIGLHLEIKSLKSGLFLQARKLLFLAISEKMVLNRFIMSHRKIIVWPDILKIPEFVSKIKLQNSHKSFSMYFVCRNHEKKMLKILHKTKIKQKSALVGLAKKVQKRVQKKISRIIWEFQLFSF